MRGGRGLGSLLMLLLVAGSCGDDAAMESTTTAPTTTLATTAATTTTTTLPPPEWGSPWLWLSTSDGLVKVDGETGKQVAEIPLEGMHDAVLGPGGIWVSQCTAHTLSLVSTETDEVVASILVEGCPSNIATFAGTVLVLAQHRQAIVQIDPFGFEVIAEYMQDPYGPDADIEGAANLAEAIVAGSDWSLVLGYAAAGNLLVTIRADGPVAAAAVGPGNILMVVLQDGRVQFFDRWGNLVGRDHTQMTPYQATWEDGRFCIVGWGSSGQSRVLCGDPLNGEPFVGQSAQVGTVAATAYGGTLYTTSSEGDLAAQTIGDPASFHELGETGNLTHGLLAAPKNPQEGGNEVTFCPLIAETEEAAYYQTVIWPQVERAMRNPAGVPGWGQPTDPTRPAGPDNPPVTSIGVLSGSGYDYWLHPLGAKLCPAPVPASLVPRLCPELARLNLDDEEHEFAAAVFGGLHEPSSVPGWGQPVDASRPSGPDNPLQNALGLTNPDAPWDRESNPLVYKACGQDAPG